MLLALYKFQGYQILIIWVNFIQNATIRSKLR